MGLIKQKKRLGGGAEGEAGEETVYGIAEKVKALTLGQSSS